MVEFSCPKCGCKRFTLVKKNFIDVDFSQEGAIKGHPAISRHLVEQDSGFEYFLCYECGEEVPTEQGEKMFVEVI